MGRRLLTRISAVGMVVAELDEDIFQLELIIVIADEKIIGAHHYNNHLGTCHLGS